MKVPRVLAEWPCDAPGGETSLRVVLVGEAIERRFLVERKETDGMGAPVWLSNGYVDSTKNEALYSLCSALESGWVTLQPVIPLSKSSK